MLGGALADQLIIGSVQDAEQRHDVDHVDEDQRGEAPPREGGHRRGAFEALRDGVADAGKERGRGHLCAHGRSLERGLVPLLLLIQAEAPPVRQSRTFLRHKAGRASAGVALLQVPARRLAVRRHEPSGACQRDDHEKPAQSAHASAPPPRSRPYRPSRRRRRALGGRADHTRSASSGRRVGARK